MDFLVIGGIILRVLTFRRLQDERGGTELVRTLSGKLRGDPDWVARAWEAEVIMFSDAEANALYGVLGSAVACSGAGLPGAVTAAVEVTGDTYNRTPDTGYDRVISLSIRETL